MSTQQDRYLAARARGKVMFDACVISGIPIAEARLIEAAIARGEIELPVCKTDENYSDPIPDTPAAGIAASQQEAVMARKAKPNDGEKVTNLTDTKHTIRDAVARILKLKSERKEINAAIGEQRARVRNCGVPPAALDLAIRMKEADEEDRQAHDEGYAIARDALGMGLQRSLFETIESAPADEPANDEVDALDAAE